MFEYQANLSVRKMPTSLMTKILDSLLLFRSRQYFSQKFAFALIEFDRLTFVSMVMENFSTGIIACLCRFQNLAQWQRFILFYMNIFLVLP